MAKQILIRLARLIGTLLAVSFLTFSMTLLLPGDPVNSILPPTTARDPETVSAIRDELDLDDPLLARYASWLGDAVRGDLGRSYIDNRPVATTIAERLPITAQLAVMAVGMAVLAAVPIGVLGAYRQGRASDQVSSALVQVALSIPNFITGVFLIWLLTVRFNLLPSTGWNRIGTDGWWRT